MENYNLINKGVIPQNEDCQIDKLEYMLIEETDSSSSLVVFKVFNRNNYMVKSFDILVHFYDEDNTLLSSENYKLENLDIKPNSSKIPLCKIKGDLNCYTIEADIINIDLEEVLVESDSMIDQEDIVSKEPSYFVDTVQLRAYKFPYLITLTISIIFCLIIISVFNYLN